MRSVCKHAHLSCQFKAFLFRDLFNQLEDGSIDLAVASIIISKDRQQDFLFSYPYLPSSAQFFTRKDADINSLADIKGKIINTVDDPILIKYITDNYSKNNIIKSEHYQSLDSALDDLQSGKIDVFFLDKKAAEYWIANNNQQLKPIGPEIRIGLGYAIVAGLSNHTLINSVNDALTAMEKDGSFASIFTCYF